MCRFSVGSTVGCDRFVGAFSRNGETPFYFTANLVIEIITQLYKKNPEIFLFALCNYHANDGQVIYPIIEIRSQVQ